MSVAAELPLPDEGVHQEPGDPVLQFVWFPGMSYGRRILLVSGLVVLGLFLQVLVYSAWVGAPLLLAALLLSWVVGLDNKVDRRGFHHDVAWETVPFDRVRTIQALDRKSKSWDWSLFDITSAGGCVMFFLAGGFLAFLVMGFLGSADRTIATIVGVDGGLLILAQWFNGMRFTFRQPDLMVKVDHVLKVERLAGGLGGDRVLQAQLQMQGRDELRIPTDLKLTVDFAEPPEGFLGVQAQVVLNRVQGTPYPYFYAVVLSREGNDLFEHAEGIALPEGVIRERRTQDGVDIVILRQATTKTSGYHTKPKVSAKILRLALETANRHLKQRRA